MELKEYIRLLRNNWMTVLALAVAGVTVGAAYSWIIAPEYVSETKLFAATQSSDSISELQLGNSFTQARVQSYAQTAETPLVLQPVIDSLGLEVTPAELAERVDATADLNTVLLTITVRDTSPVQAAAIARSVGGSLVDAIEELEKTSEAGPSPVRLSVVTPATAPASPASPNIPVNLLVGLFVGTLIGLTASFLRSTLDTWIRSSADLSPVTELPVLGGITFDTDAAKKPLLTQTSAQSPRAESFRQIRTNLQFAHVSHASKAILITSSLPGEGKSTTATNLAIAMAQAGQSVVLVDADLRRPRVDEYLGLERNAGLTTALIGRADVTDLLQPWGEGELYVLTSGQIPPNPSELLGSQAMKQLIGQLERTFDSIIIDAPPLLPVTDGAVLAQQVGGVVLVVGSSKVKAQDVQRSLASLEMVNADILGIVLNLLPAKGPDAYAYSYYSYEADASKTLSRSQRTSGARFRSQSFDFHEQVLPSRANQRG